MIHEQTTIKRTRFKLTKNLFLMPQVDYDDDDDDDDVDDNNNNNKRTSGLSSCAIDFTRSTVRLALFLALHCITRNVISTAVEEARAKQAGRERWSRMVDSSLWFDLYI
jgi:hypothetical protein